MVSFIEPHLAQLIDRSSIPRFEIAPGGSGPEYVLNDSQVMPVVNPNELQRALAVEDAEREMTEPVIR
jgi:hypothetical protein